MSLDDKKVFTENLNLPLATVKDMMDDGDIIPNPDYQRDYVYDDKKASKLVESILMGIPIPTLYLCQEDDETLSVIDGQQRITSFYKYMSNEFPLRGLDELRGLNGKFYKELDKPIQKKLKASTLSAIKILKESQELKYEIFARLNQGAVALKPQELRNCIYRGSFNIMLEDLAKNKNLELLFHEPNNRKAYQERILRYFALKDYKNYKAGMKKFLNNYMYLHQNEPEDSISKMKSEFNSKIDIIKQVLGNTAFFAVDRERNRAVERFSGSVYDSIIVAFSFFDNHDLMVNADKIRKAINELKSNDEQYREDTYAATGSTNRVISRIDAVYNLLHNIIGSYGKTPESQRTFQKSIKEELFHEGYICSYCNNVILSIDDAEVDHIIPFSRGGTTTIDNAQLLHRHCNREKNAAVDEDDEDEDN